MAGRRGGGDDAGAEGLGEGMSLGITLPPPLLSILHEDALPSSSRRSHNPLAALTTTKPRFLCSLPFFVCLFESSLSHTPPVYFISFSCGFPPLKRVHGVAWGDLFFSSSFTARIHIVVISFLSRFVLSFSQSLPSFPFRFLFCLEEHSEGVLFGSLLQAAAEFGQREVVAFRSVNDAENH